MAFYNHDVLPGMSLSEHVRGRYVNNFQQQQQTSYGSSPMSGNGNLYPASYMQSSKSRNHQMQQQQQHPHHQEIHRSQPSSQQSNRTDSNHAQQGVSHRPVKRGVRPNSFHHAPGADNMLTSGSWHGGQPHSRGFEKVHDQQQDHPRSSSCDSLSRSSHHNSRPGSSHKNNHHQNNPKSGPRGDNAGPRGDNAGVNTSNHTSNSFQHSYKKPLMPNRQAYLAMGCEKVGTVLGESVAARVVFIDWKGRAILDTLVNPVDVSGEIADYRTHVTGIAPEQLHTAPSFATVRNQAQALIQDKILVGHAVENELKALNLEHPWLQIRDTAFYQPFMKERPITEGSNYTGPLHMSIGSSHCGPHSNTEFISRPLKELAKEKLQREIQMPKEPHCPIQDAMAALDLYKSHRPRWEACITTQLQKEQKAAMRDIQRQQQPNKGFPNQNHYQNNSNNRPHVSSINSINTTEKSNMSSHNASYYHPSTGVTSAASNSFTNMSALPGASNLLPTPPGFSNQLNNNSSSHAIVTGLGDNFGLNINNSSHHSHSASASPWGGGGTGVIGSGASNAGAGLILSSSFHSTSSCSTAFGNGSQYGGVGDIGSKRGIHDGGDGGLRSTSLHGFPSTQGFVQTRRVDCDDVDDGWSSLGINNCFGSAAPTGSGLLSGTTSNPGGSLGLSSSLHSHNTDGKISGATIGVNRTLSGSCTYVNNDILSGLNGLNLGNSGGNAAASFLSSGYNPAQLYSGTSSNARKQLLRGESSSMFSNASSFTDDSSISSLDGHSFHDPSKDLF